MIQITDGKKVLNVPDATAEDTLKQKWLKKWTIVKHVGTAPQEVIQFQEAKLKEKKAEDVKADDIKGDVTCCKDNCIKDDCCKELSVLSLRKLEERVDDLTSEQLLFLSNDPRKSVKQLAEKQLKKLSNVSGE